ncbi:MAG TPA: lipocalin-like domain-containing protein [Candidatus Sulfotelmatobacter sp.]|nr:lipocalin-like domain-containing protein [Candidatus Sulfotelmatobacter sp.]
MKSSARAWLLLIAASCPAAAQYKVAMPGYHYEFPRDHFNHPEFQTEWWYYTGNLTASDGHRFGFELTFFREGRDRDSQKQDTWDIQDLYLAHLALSDLDGNAFYHTERTNRAGPGIAGIEESRKLIWNGNWKVAWKGTDQELEAMDEHFSFSLNLHPEKPPVIHGENGVSQKAEGPGHASHYISLTRLQTSGAVQLNGKSYTVFGAAWMDHEFFTHQLERDQIGWDWFSMQLNDNSELMLFRIRRKDGSVDPFSAGTYIDPGGHSVHLRTSDFALLPKSEVWKSPDTRAAYPVQWHIVVSKLGLELEVTTALKAQELTGNFRMVPNYWEGAIDLKGQRGSAAVAGVGYLEMTGYDRAVELGR